MPTTTKTVTIPTPTFEHPDPHDTPEKTLRRVVSNLRGGYPIGGSNVTHGVAEILEHVADALAAGPQQAVTAEAHHQALQAERDYHLAMHEAFKPEAVAEIAVHLGSHEDWDRIAEWCGGQIESIEDASGSGEYSSQIVLSDGQVASEQTWITLDHQGTFRVRENVDGPEVQPR